MKKNFVTTEKDNSIIEITFINLVLKCPASAKRCDCPFNSLRKLFSNRIREVIPYINMERVIDILNDHKLCYSSLNTNNKNVKKNKNHRDGALIWKNNFNIGLLTFELKARNYIKYQNEFACIFNCEKNNTTLHWNRNFILHLAYLLFLLKEKGHIRCQGSKGLFKKVQEILVDFNNEPFPKNSLVKLSSKIVKNKSNYSDIVANIEKIVSAFERTKIDY